MEVLIGILIIALVVCSVNFGRASSSEKAALKVHKMRNIVLFNFIDVMKELNRAHAAMNGKIAPRRPDFGDIKSPSNTVVGDSHGLEYSFDPVRGTIELKQALRNFDSHNTGDRKFKRSIVISLKESTSSMDIRRIEWLFFCQKNNQWSPDEDINITRESVMTV